MKTKLIKSLSVLLAVVLLATAAPLSGFVGLDLADFKLFGFEAAAKSGNLAYYVSVGEVRITDCDESASGNMVIPSNIDGYPVTSISWRAFEDCTGITSITIPDSVTSIGLYAFKNCTGLTSITIPDSVTSIDDGAFCGCTGITSITIPDSVTSIGENAFVDCTSLTSITLSDSVTSIESEAFYNTGYYNNSSNWKNGVLYIGNHLIKAKDSIKGAYKIKSGTRCIAYAAFHSCTGLTSITIPDSVTSISYCAFYGCTGLTSIKIGNSVTSIGNYAFDGCTGLKSITIPNSVTSISYCAFYGCTGLTSVTIGNSVTSIGDFAFDGCTGLTSITIPDSVTSIASGAFWNTAYYNNSSNWENDVLYIGNHLIIAKDSIKGAYKIKSGTRCIAYAAFHSCTGLTSITIPDSVTSIDHWAFSGCTGLTSITIPDSVTNINDSAFYGCTGLTSVTIGNSVTSIGGSAFSGCTGLTSITIPDSVTSIGYEAFYGCTGLTSVTIPDSVTSICGSAFYGCTGLTSVTIGNSVTSIGSNAFNGCTGLTSITIPDSVTSIDKFAFKSYKNLECVTIGNSVTSIDYRAFKDCVSLTRVTIGNSVTSIGYEAFEGCKSLTSITIPNSVTSIGNNAFRGCSSLESVTIGNSVTSIDYRAFKDCVSLTRVTIGNSVTSIGYEAFYGCTGLTSITIPNSVTSIGSYVFEDCTGLTSITIPDSVTSIRYRAFCGCTGLKSITIPNSVTSIGNDAFNGCTGLTSITIPNSVTSIGSYAFYGCNGITSITIPDSMTSIGKYAFGGCTGIKDVYYTGSEEQWKKISIGSSNSYLTSANIIYNATPLHGSNSTTKKVQPVTEKTFKFSVYSKSETFCGVMSGFTVKGAFGEQTGSEKISIQASSLKDENITFSSSGHYSVVLPSEVYNSFQAGYISSDKKTYEIPRNIYLKKRTDNDDKYISVVYGRVSGKGEYSNLENQKIEISEDTKVDIIITSVGMTNPTYYISQDETHKVSSTTGKLSAASLYSKLSFNKDTYVYAVDSDGTTTETVKIKLAKKVTLSDAAQALADSTTYSFLGKGGVFGLSISDSMPIFGGSTLALDAFKVPIGVDYDDDGNVKISIGFNFFEKKYDYDDSKWETTKGWEAFKKSFKSVSKTIKDTTDSYDDWYDNWYTLENLKKQYSGKNVFKTGDPNKDKGFNASFLGYIEGKIVNGDFVFKEGSAVVSGNFKYKYSQQVALWAVPGYYYFEASCGLKLSGEVARKIADSNLPIELEATLEIEPGLAVGAGVGIVGFASAGLRGEGSLPVSYEFVKQHLNVSLKGAIKAEGQFFVFKGEKTLLEGNVELIDKTFGIQKRKSAAYINRAYLNELETQTEVSVLSREYAENTSEWLGGENKSKLKKSKAIKSDGVTFTDLQTSVFESGMPQIVSFGNKKLMTWIEDDSSRDEYNRMRLVYSVYDGTTWSEPKAVCDDGHNDTAPTLAYDGENVYVAWQKIKRDLVADDANDIDALLSEAEIYLAKYDSENDKFVDTKALTDNDTYDYNATIAGENGSTVVYFVSGDPSSTTGNKIIRYDVRENSFKTSADDLAYVSNITAEFVDGKDEVSYSVDTDNDLTTTNDISIFTVRGDTKTQFEMPEDHDSAVQFMTYGTLDNEKTLYISDGSNVYYVKNGETQTAFSSVAAINGNFTYCKVGSTDALFWTGTTDTGSELYLSSYDDGKWSEPVKISDCQDLLTTVSIISENDTIFGVCNKTETTATESGYEKGQTDLCSFTFTDFDDIGVTLQSIDETQVVPGEKVNIDVMLSNNGTQKVQQVKFYLTDTFGTDESFVKDVEIPAGEIVSTSIEYTVPTNYASGSLTVEVEPISGNDKNDSDNSSTIDIGKSDITISEAEVSTVGNTYIVTSYIYNNSPITAQNVTLKAIAYDETNDPFSQTTVGEVKQGECNIAQIEINANDVEFDENGVARFYLKAENENDANDIDNTSSVILEKEAENECGHPVWEENESESKAPTCTEKGQKAYTCAACGEKKYEESDALDHSYSSDWTVDTEPTCTIAGSKSHHCTRCDAKTDVTEIAKTGHKYTSYKTTVKATCTETGKKQRTCQNCGKVQTKTISALGHSYSTDWTVDKAATCTTAGSKSHHCTRCDAKTDVTEIAKTGHSYTSYKTTVKATCTETGTKQRTCNNCGKVQTKTISALGHSYSTDWTVDKAATCTKAGSKSHHCTRCDAKTDVTEIAKTGHSYTSKVTKKATCSETGVRTYTCSNCGRTYTKSISKLSHTYKTTTTTKATTSKNGTKTTKCTVCGKVKSTTTIAKISTVKLSYTSYTYSGSTKKPTVTVTDANGNKLTKDTDYTVKYASDRKNVGKYTVTVTFKGNYSGTKTLTFTIKPKGATISKLTAGTKKFTVKLNELPTQITGYQIQYSTSSKMTSATTKTYTTATKTSRTISNLKSAKTYYVRVRTYKTVDGAKIYSSWSSVKNVKTK